MNHYQEYLNINERKGLPRSYWFNQLIRWFTILFSVFAIIYAVWLIFNKIDADSATFAKVVPFLIIFFALNSLLRNSFTLNRIYFSQSGFRLDYLLRKSIYIEWKNLRSLKLQSSRQKLLRIGYLDEQGNEKVHELTFAFPKMLEILNAIVELQPQVELDEFLASVIVAEKKPE